MPSEYTRKLSKCFMNIVGQEVKVYGACGRNVIGNLCGMLGPIVPY